MPHSFRRRGKRWHDMPTYVVDPTLFEAEGAVINWAITARRLGMFDKNYGPVIELRWMLNDQMGIPTEPFEVWSRPHTTQPPWNALSITQRQLEFLGFFT